MGIIGFGRIGQETAKIALGIGMNVLYTDKFVGKTQINLNLANDKKISFDLESSDMTELLNEPKPSVKLLMHPKVSLTPHIGAATNEAQDRIGIELANQIMTLVKE